MHVITFDFLLPLSSYILFGCAIIVMVYLICFYILPLLKIIKYQKNRNTQLNYNDIEYPTVSIIVYCQDEPDVLRQTLEKVAQQDYPAKFEIIVVNDGASADVSMIAGSLKTKYTNIYITFTPKEAKSLSRKKLSLTIGIKAASCEVIVVIDDKTLVPSDQWLRYMCSPFIEKNIEVVIGCGIPFDNDKTSKAIYNYGFDETAWILGAIKHHPYRSLPYNVAYLRRLFFEQKGFSNSINLHKGDDDIFISEISNSNNCNVQLAPQSIVKNLCSSISKEVKNEELSHFFTSKKLYKGSRRILSVGSFLGWIEVALLISAIFTAPYTNAVSWLISSILLITLISLISITWKRVFRTLGIKAPTVWIPFFYFVRPLHQLKMKILSKKNVKNNYAWQ